MTADDMKRALELASISEAAYLRGDTMYFNRDERSLIARALIALQAENERTKARCIAKESK